MGIYIYIYISLPSGGFRGKFGATIVRGILELG
jgi:hypothetical protein